MIVDEQHDLQRAKESLYILQRGLLQRGLFFLLHLCKISNFWQTVITSRTSLKGMIQEDKSSQP